MVKTKEVSLWQIFGPQEAVFNMLKPSKLTFQKSKIKTNGKTS